MPTVELIMPKMGESITEATILSWLKNEGDAIEVDEPILEIATDKVDSEVPSPHGGVLVKKLFNEGDVVEVGKAIAVINTGGETSPDNGAPAVEPKPEPVIQHAEPVATAQTAQQPVTTQVVSQPRSSNGNGRFYSPLVMNIAQREGISMTELEQVPGSGKNGRVSKKDILSYIENRGAHPVVETVVEAPAIVTETITVKKDAAPASVKSYGDNVEIEEMDRMRKLISHHMIESTKTSAHVTSFVEADVTNLVMWRNKIKKGFQEKYGEKITYTPIFVEALVKAINDFPRINASLDGNKIIYKKDINIGMAAALANGNLIVPVIKNADQLNMLGLTKKVNDLANRARNNKLKPDEIEGGTYTLSNVGTFGNVMGTPIINQPQLAIMAVGAIRKKPVVIEAPSGDTIGIRHMMFLSHSYDHRIIDGFIGGSFVRKVADYLEAFDIDREI